LAAHSAVISGASSGSRQVGRERFDFTFISLPHRYNTSGTTARCPDYDDNSIIKPSGRDETLLAILVPVVWARQMCNRKHLARPPKVQASFLQSLVALGPVKGDPHRIYCSYI
jgi:hypothetical protein